MSRCLGCALSVQVRAFVSSSTPSLARVGVRARVRVKVRVRVRARASVMIRVRGAARGSKVRRPTSAGEYCALHLLRSRVPVQGEAYTCD